MRVTDTLWFVRGDWLVSRSLADHRTGIRGRFTGTASFAPVPGTPGRLCYREQGELRFGGHRGPAWRELLWLAAPAGTADVRFADGRPFYLADLRAGRWQAEHHCGSDLYHVTYHVLGPGRLLERWRAHGPGKDYLSATTLVRDGRLAPAGDRSQLMASAGDSLDP
ncbi:MAG: DUF6314 family protein [Nocardiopsaceae bacterium]|jgi:hypothetical protein|nr:DUF6314 family protein [Nocardiopsaceae bacterium]